MNADFQALISFVAASDAVQVEEFEKLRPGTLRSARGPRGETLLFHGTDARVLQALLAAGVDPAVVDCDGWLAHDKHCAGDDSELVEPLLAAFSPDLIDRADEFGTISLHRCALFNSPRCAALLLRFGSAVDLADEDGFTALIHASIGQAYEVAEVLLQHGADPARPTNGGHSSLDFARNAGDERMIETLSAGPNKLHTGGSP